MEYFNYKESFSLERGGRLAGLTIAFETYGRLNHNRDNVIWICHALTANASPVEWWPGMVGQGCAFDTGQYFVVCANMLGSCYGTTGPLSVNPDTGSQFFHSFPDITVRDMVRAHQLLFRHLGINKIHLLAGGSMGGYQALEWCMMEPEAIEQLFLIATSARESAWGIAIHTTQRLAIEADATWPASVQNAGQKGLKAARAIGMLTYRGYNTYHQTQDDQDPEKMDNFRASSYINYQGEKLVKRFNAFSYWCLTKAMDSHNIARGRAKNVESALGTIKKRTLVVGIRSDILCPLHELELLADNIPDSQYFIIDSVYGHDGFLVETAAISGIIQSWLRDNTGKA